MRRRNNDFSRLIEKILKAEYVYIKDTGIEVLVTNIEYHKDLARIKKFQKILANITFKKSPTKKAVFKCEHFTINVRELLSKTSGPPTQNTINSAAYDIQVNATISVDNLSITPYESKAAKILYKK